MNKLYIVNRHRVSLYSVHYIVYIVHYTLYTITSVVYIYVSFVSALRTAHSLSRLSHRMHSNQSLIHLVLYISRTPWYLSSVPGYNIQCTWVHYTVYLGTLYRVPMLPCTMYRCNSASAQRCVWLIADIDRYYVIAREQRSRTRSSAHLVPGNLFISS